MGVGSRFLSLTTNKTISQDACEVKAQARKCSVVFGDTHTVFMILISSGNRNSPVQSLVGQGRVTV
ncbi:MAG: hypothetical protein CME21_16485 [Gemmatimonadetes bacterium]|nr:hypothetical protein [Gemmatimonadota bacterium]